jgi:hypothetical protein
LASLTSSPNTPEKVKLITRIKRCTRRADEKALNKNKGIKGVDLIYFGNYSIEFNIENTTSKILLIHRKK